MKLPKVNSNIVASVAVGFLVAKAAVALAGSGVFGETAADYANRLR